MNKQELLFIIKAIRELWPLSAILVVIVLFAWLDGIIK